MARKRSSDLHIIIYLLHAAASTLTDWNVTVVNKTASSIGVSWSNPASVLNGGIRFYFALARKINSSSESVSEIVAGNVTALEFKDLETFREYIVAVVAVNVDGTPFESAEVSVNTDEGGKNYLKWYYDQIFTMPLTVCKYLH